MILSWEQVQFQALRYIAFCHQDLISLDVHRTRPEYVCIDPGNFARSIAPASDLRLHSNGIPHASQGGGARRTPPWLVLEAPSPATHKLRAPVSALYRDRRWESSRRSYRVFLKVFLPFGPVRSRTILTSHCSHFHAASGRY